MTDVSESYLESLRDRAEFAEETLTAEQREHDITRRQRDTLQTQCEDMQSEMETERKTNNAALTPSVGVDNQAIVDIVVEKDDKISILMQRVAHADERLETANAMATTYADANASLKRELATTTQRLENSLNVTDEMVNTDMKDEMACMAEEVIGLKADIADLQGAVDGANELRDSYKQTALTLSDDRAKLMQEIHTLKDSAETQTMHMQQVDAACKAAESKVIEQRKEIEALKSGEDLWICPSVDKCEEPECRHYIPHVHNGDCNGICPCGFGACVKVNTCKECATLREEIINRDAVILEKERKADRTDEIIHKAVTELKELRGLVDKRNVASEKHNRFIALFSCKAGDLQTPTTKHPCKWYDVCTIASETSHTCIANEGQHCGRKREIDTKHGVMQ